MTELEFAEYMKISVPLYAAEKQRGEGLTPEEAKTLAESAFKALLPDGLASPKQYLFSIFDDSLQKKVGILWLGIKQNGSISSAYIYDIIIDDQYRTKGYGKAAMMLVEEEARKLGLNAIGLHVFGHNQVARKLYEKLGYIVTNQVMKKIL